jgi:hypothetical protein
VTKTPELIDALVERAGPVGRLRPPLVRSCGWLVLAGLVLVLLAAVHGMRSDLAERLRQPAFLVSLGAALATGALAAVASFMISLPDRPRWWLLLPAPALAVWVSTIGYGCITDWVSIGPDGIRLGETIRCFATLLLTSIPLTLGMLVMLRYAALLRASAAAVTAGLAVGAMTAAALLLLHELDATAMILLWNAGVVMLIAGLGRAFGRRTLLWVASHVGTTEMRAFRSRERS